MINIKPVCKLTLSLDKVFDAGKVACNAGDQRTAYNIKVHVFKMYKICIKSAGHSLIRTLYYEKMNTTLKVKLLSQQHFCEHH